MLPFLFDVTPTQTRDLLDPPGSFLISSGLPLIRKMGRAGRQAGRQAGHFPSTSIMWLLHHYSQSGDLFLFSFSSLLQGRMIHIQNRSSYPYDLLQLRGSLCFKEQKLCCPGKIFRCTAKNVYCIHLAAFTAWKPSCLWLNFTLTETRLQP